MTDAQTFGSDPLEKLFELLGRRGHEAPGLRADLRAAYTIAERAHAGELRKSGEPYISHPVAVAEIAATLPYPPDLVVAALLHDVADSGVPLETLAGEVAPDVLAVVAAQLELDHGGDRFALRRRLTAPAEGRLTSDEITDLAIALKIADRLHNARTWRYVPAAKARLKATQTLDIIAPAAAAAGLTDVRDELLALSHATLRQSRTLRSPGERRSGAPADRAVHRLMHRALDRVPAELRERYAEEWPADLAAMTRRRERWMFALGLQYSARALGTDRGK